MTVKTVPARDVPTLAARKGEIRALTGPLSVRVETTAGPVDSVVLPRVRFDEIEELLEDRAAEAAFRRTRDEERFPRALADRLMAGDNPVRVFREHREMTAARLARAAGISRGYLSEIEAGKKPGSAAVLRRIADALGVDLDNLV